MPGALFSRIPRMTEWENIRQFQSHRQRSGVAILSILVIPSSTKYTQPWHMLFLYVEYSSFRHMHGLLLHLLQVIAQILPIHWGFLFKIEHTSHYIPLSPLICLHISILYHHLSLSKIDIFAYLVSSMRTEIFNKYLWVRWINGWMDDGLKDGQTDEHSDG